MDASILIQQLTSDDVIQRRQAAEAFAKSPDDAISAVIPLCRGCSDKDEQVAEWCVGALEELPPCDKQELPALVEMLPSKKELTAYWAATLIGRLEGKGEPAALPLAKIIAGKTPTAVKDRAIWAVRKIGVYPPEVIAALETASKSDNPRTARLANKALDKR